MSNTIVDMPKVTQMLDAGWRVMLFKGGMGSYEVRAVHPEELVMRRVRRKLEKGMKTNGDSAELVKNVGITFEQAVDDWHFDDGELMTDDFTPQQALTRMAYKVHGEIL